MYHEQSTMDYLYGPLTKDYCVYFYFLSVFGFIMLCFAAVSSLFFGIFKKKGFEFFSGMFMVCLAYGLFYFQNRLLYSMCVGSLKN
jgi:hypothetical protein